MAGVLFAGAPLAGALAALLVLAPVLVAGAQQAAPTEAEPSATCAERLASIVQRRYEAVHDLSAHFEQRTRSVMLAGSALGEDAPTTGQVVFAKPGKMRWSYESPRPSLVVSDGQTLWIYDPEAREVQRFPVTQGYLSGAALQFLLGEGNLLESFHVTAEACDEAAQEVDLALVPKSPASYERLGLRVKRADGEILSTTVIDLFGNETRIDFREIVTNRDPEASSFVFVPSKGTRVIDLTP